MEIFKVIEDEPRYSISNLGKVMNNLTGRMVTGSIGKRGYWVVDFRLNVVINGKICKRGKTRTIHQLVGIHFIDNPEKHKEIDHIDRNKLNNEAINLRWSSSLHQKLNVAKYTKREYSSKYKGVCWDKFYKKWKAGVSVNNTSVKVGYFDLESDAALAYNQYYIDKGLADVAYLNVIE